VAHLFVDSINGVGTKIASFYLRDIAYLSGIDETQIVDEHYLQPMDTWLEQSLRIIMRNSIPKKLQDRQRAIVDLCHQAGCSPIAFNQGAWVLGSQIAKNFNTFRKIASGDSVNQYLEDYIAEKRIYLQAI
jgi:thermostable 8-oxoguanine DNA glycosylase